MDQIQKDLLRENTQKHVHIVQSHIKQEKTGLQTKLHKLDEIVKGAEKGSHDEENVDIEKILMSEKKQRVDELSKLTDSPYFTKCIVRFDGEKEDKTIYFGKFPFFPDAISSWTTPIAKLRYEIPGKFVYDSLSGVPISGELKYKEQYMIVDGRLVFMAAEGMDNPRELIYQERLMRKKTEFSLPEIVEQMEKAQDEVIRAHWKGSYLISGPAGSGKTTLALHRVAYLTQAPETEQLFPSQTIIVFVQDASTKKYFSNLLPELGIKKVKITTFDEWIFEILKLHDQTFVQKYGKTETQKDNLEYFKNKALKSFKKKDVPTEPITAKNFQEILLHYYKNHFEKEMLHLVSEQFIQNKIDRFDISLLTKMLIIQQGSLTEEKEHYELFKGMKHKKTIKKVPIQYSLIVVDEAENFLQEQIEIILSCVSKKTQAVLYVGDLAQQTKAYTIKDWNSVGESFAEGRKVVLSKVYRNTKQILEYIQSVGFKTNVPDGVNTGKAVEEYIILNKAHEIEQVEKIIEGNKSGVVGIMAKTVEYLESYRKVFSDFKNVKILTINEAQGVEFDVAVLVGVDSHYFAADHPDSKFALEQKHVNHDLLYVALTRAMNELYIFSTEPLKNVVGRLS